MKRLLPLSLMAAVMIVAGCGSSDTPRPEQTVQARLEEGRTIYGRNCQSCHQAEGTGLSGMTASLRDSAVLKGGKEDAIRYLLDESSRKRQITRSMVAMPVYLNLSDQDIADILNYARTSFVAAPADVMAADVAAVRSRIHTR